MRLRRALIGALAVGALVGVVILLGLVLVPEIRTNAVVTADLSPVRGMFVAQEIKLQAKTLASDRSIDWVEVDYDELRGIERPRQKLF